MIAPDPDYLLPDGAWKITRKEFCARRTQQVRNRVLCVLVRHHGIVAVNDLAAETGIPSHVIGKCVVGFKPIRVIRRNLKSFYCLSERPTTQDGVPI